MWWLRTLFQSATTSPKTSFIGSLNIKKIYLMADDSKLYISLHDKPIYLQVPRHKSNNICSKQRGAADAVPLDRHSYSFVIVFDPFPSLLIHHNPEKERHGPDKLYVYSCLLVQKLYRQLCDSHYLSSRVEFALGARITCSGLVRHLFALVKDDSVQNADEIWYSLNGQADKNDENFKLSIYEKDTFSKISVLWKLKNICKTNQNDAESPLMLEENFELELPRISPIFQDAMNISPVFHNQERVMLILEMFKQYSNSPEVCDLLDIARKEMAEQKSLSELKDMMKYPLIVIEGLDATGKTTLTHNLEKTFLTVRFSTPPPCLLHLRPFFDQLPEIVRRAYYCLGNYIVAQQIARECQHRAVVMDRFWHSTAAYGIANETSTWDLPPADHSIYFWPQDLVQPSAVIYLKVSEKVRHQRMQSCHEKVLTFEEDHLNKVALFRQRLCEAYNRMSDPPFIQVDANGTKEEVVEIVLKNLELHGIHLE